MATIYTTRNGDVLDWICWRHYQTEAAIAEVLAANPHLSSLPVILPAGISISLPPITPRAATEEVDLWS